MKEIKLTRGKVALVDDEDYELLNKHRWFALRGKYTWYVVRSKRQISGGTTIYMHRIILNAKENEICDHIDHNGLNNQRDNLRIVSWRESNLSRYLQKNNPSGYTGVYRTKTSGRWWAKAQIHGIQKYIGTFDTAEKAHKARQENLKIIDGD